MAARTAKQRNSAFKELGLRKSIAALVEEVQALYLEDEIPWVVGYSGGKDSSATLQLVWLALQQMEADKRTKPVHVISTDTLVENPVVASWVGKSLETMGAAASAAGLPLQAHRLIPAISDRFWVNLLGRGYPAPRHKFRWCTERLKINPSNKFISDVVKKSGEAILVLGTRKAESSRRAHTMNKLEKQRMRARLSPNASLPNSLVYSPIEDWTNDDVWLFLMQFKNPWGINNKDLLTMYQGASADGECPLVIDTTTPSCGDSRFGCWVCTMVDQDRSMKAMIQNDEEKQWMTPLLQLRDKLGIWRDKQQRDFRRITGKVQLFHDQPIHGPYKQEVRAELLREVLRAEVWIQENGPEYVHDIELISMDELAEIRRIWMIDKHEIEDLLPGIYEEVYGQPYPDAWDDNRVFGTEEMELLRDVCGDNRFQFELARELLDVEWQYRNMLRRNGLYEELEGAFKRNFFVSRDDAIEHARKRRDAMKVDIEPKIPEIHVNESREQSTNQNGVRKGQDNEPPMGETQSRKTRKTQSRKTTGSSAQSVQLLLLTEERA